VNDRFEQIYQVKRDLNEFFSQGGGEWSRSASTTELGRILLGLRCASRGACAEPIGHSRGGRTRAPPDAEPVLQNGRSS
ncbi:MAG TPA: hypothetical protein VK933_02755, partial [Longimicrobiales bacterium]|nr:hypothetical protein [Longimicrobiales bacterium]